MDEQKQQSEEKQMLPEEKYVPRPAWQLWAARVGLVLFILLVILQVVQMVRGFQ